ncbi:MAG: hypothetical protein AW09_001097 [Candidatus Accumulibacter phosphatis]|uniref:Uncharacterized protein n=1 Tax=Candidatus Accumulibacter phosphatis TaxID=327160 RepID=A0A080LZZ9_9PROT|nr:MAG: hypothetical protein AW09_001097 [Candidatus Accumulibacter phosphatis]
MFPDGAFGRYLYKRGVLLKDAGKFFEGETEALIQHAKASAWKLSGVIAGACTCTGT